MQCARLDRYGLLEVSGADAREFLHAQLTVDIRNLSPQRTAFGGWCSARGRLLATFFVIPASEGFLLQLARDLASPIAKRLSMFVLRSKVRILDQSDSWVQYGVWDVDWDAGAVSWAAGRATIPIGSGRFLRLEPAGAPSLQPTADQQAWIAQEIRAGRPFISAATQDQFLPQMVNLEAFEGVDFRKGCYPGQEIVARAQYRGQVKRRMVRVPTPQGIALRPGEQLNGGVVVDSAEGEALVVMPQ